MKICTVPMAEEVVTAIGESEALALASTAAEKRLPGARLVVIERQGVPAVDPETGVLLPPIRLYCFEA